MTKTTKMNKPKRFVRLGDKVLAIFTQFGVEVAYTVLRTEGRSIFVTFFGFVGPNGPSNYKLKKAVPLTPMEEKKLISKYPFTV